MICAVARLGHNFVRQFSEISTKADDLRAKPYYVTTPIFYVNAAPHVGHLYSMVLADVLKRWQVLQGRQALLCTGTDEHGMKVQRAAAKEGLKPMPFTDKGAQMFKSLAIAGSISNDYFVRTTDADHREAVQHVWTLLLERDYIYLSKHEGWYSVSDETFYPASAVHLIVEPQTGRKIMASMETGKEVEWTSESNYKFRLSAFREPLLRFYGQNPSFVVPKARMKDVISQVEAGLEDLSVSRPASRLNWGIPVPADESQTIYVWLDALVNYITKAGYPWTPGQESILGWPADVQVIGKDITRFHCIYWPAFLIALDITPPKQILTTAFWTLGKEKMAKSTGNVVNPFFAIQRFGVDVIRHYLVHDGGIASDSAYSNEHIIERYKKGLQGGLGNLASRVLRSKKWNVREAVVTMHSRKTPSGFPNSEMTADSKSHYEQLVVCAEDFKQRMDDLDLSGAVKLVFGLIHDTNAYMQSQAIWDIASSKPQDPRVSQVVYLCVEALRISGILLQPIMPEKMNYLLDMLGIDDSMRSFEYAHVDTDGDYGSSKVELGSGHLHVLFPPLIAEE